MSNRIQYLSKFWNFNVASIFALLVKERLRQIRALKAAMNRVVEFVYGRAK